MNRRKHIPDKVKLYAALRQLGLEPHACQLDHDPALALRPINPETGDTIPPANDPDYLVWLPTEAHKLKTFGRKGESKLSISGNGDVSRAAKARRLSADEEAFRARLQAKAEGEPVERAKPSRIQSRGFPKAPPQRRASSPIRRKMEME